jgi:predicted ATP-grasp superfamily ATP-dependent carboligase
LAKILVLDGDSAAALAITRSAGRAGHWVAVGTDQNSFAPARLSRYCRMSLEYPISTDVPDEFVESVLAFVREHGINLILPVTDRTLGPLTKHRERFAGVCRVAGPLPSALEFASDKYRTSELARALGITVPKTWLIQSAAELSRCAAFGFPLVVKDRFSVRWINEKAIFGTTAYVFSAAEAEHKVSERISAGDALVQEFISGTGVGFSCLVVEGKAFLPFQWERVREVDPRGSASSARKSIPLEEKVVAQSEELIVQMGFEGVAMVEYKRTTNGDFILMEVNGRPWGSIGLPIACGIDYPRYMIDWFLSGTLPSENISYRDNVLCRRVVGEMTHLANIRAGRPPNWPGNYPTFWKSLFHMALPWRPGMCYDDVWLSDLRPGVAGIRNWFQSRVAKQP